MKNTTVSGALSIEVRDRLCQKPWCDQVEPKTLNYFKWTLKLFSQDNNLPAHTNHVVYVPEMSNESFFRHLSISTHEILYISE